MTSWREHLRRSPGTTDIVAEGGPWETATKLRLYEGQQPQRVEVTDSWKQGSSPLRDRHGACLCPVGSAVVKPSYSDRLEAAAQLPTEACHDFKAGTLESGDVEGSSFQGSMGLQGTSPVDHARAFWSLRRMEEPQNYSKAHTVVRWWRTEAGELRRKMAMLVMTLRAWRLEASLLQMVGGGQCLKRPSW